jgi:flavin reductase (DIM6/NTAB) family NADH-FMN oxidoreductase RutF
MTDLPSTLLSLDLDQPIWDRFFSVAPLVVVGTRNADGSHDLLTTHQGFTLAPANLFAFLAPPEDAAVENSLRTRTFAVSFPQPHQVAEASLAAAVAGREGRHPMSAEIPTFPTRRIDAVLMTGARLFLECETDRVVEHLGGRVLVIGRIVAAHLDRDSRRLSERDDYDLLENHPLLAFIAPGRFAAIEHTDAFPMVE